MLILNMALKHSKWRIDVVTISKTLKILICQYFRNATMYQFKIWHPELILDADFEQVIKKFKMAQ